MKTSCVTLWFKLCTEKSQLKWGGVGGGGLLEKGLGNKFLIGEYCLKRAGRASFRGKRIGGSK